MADIKFSTQQNQNGTKSAKSVGFFILFGIIAIVLIATFFNSFTIVNEGYIGVKYRFGKIVEDTLGAGLNFRIPYMEEIEQVDIREQVYSVTADAYTSDTQTVNNLILKVNYYYDSVKLSHIIKNIGVSAVESKLLVPNVAPIARNEIGKVRAESLVQSRASIQTNIQNALTEKLAGSGIVITSFALENLEFDSNFEASIQAKVIAEQDALKMQNKTVEKEEEAKQIVIAAQAEADSAKIRADAEAYSIKAVQEQLAKSPNYIEYLKITNWNGALPQAMGNEINPFMALDGSESILGRNTSPEQ